MNTKIKKGGMRLVGNTTRYVHTGYYGNGKLNYKFNTVAGGIRGKAVWYYPDGQLEREVTFRYGRWHGDFNVYHFDGKLKINAQYCRGQIVGYKCHLDRAGKIIKVLKSDVGLDDGIETEVTDLDQQQLAHLQKSLIPKPETIEGVNKTQLNWIKKLVDANDRVKIKAQYTIVKGHLTATDGFCTVFIPAKHLDADITHFDADLTAFKEDNIPTGQRDVINGIFDSSNPLQTFTADEIKNARIVDAKSTAASIYGNYTALKVNMGDCTEREFYINNKFIKYALRPKDAKNALVHIYKYHDSIQAHFCYPSGVRLVVLGVK